MFEPAAPFLGPWSAFYATIGASSATLIGLMFIVVTLAAGTERVRSTREGLATFSTPTVAHFGAVLLLAGIMLAPWRALLHAAVLLGIVGLCGIVYALRIATLTKRIDAASYVPDTEDWVWYNVMPFVAYGAVLGGAAALPALPDKALIAVAGGAMLLAFIGIRNAWDVVTYLGTRNQDGP